MTMKQMLRGVSTHDIMFSGYSSSTLVSTVVRLQLMVALQGCATCSTVARGEDATSPILRKLPLFILWVTVCLSQLDCLLQN